ncbi:MAG TPA: BamA/TamA family outer membrane protein [Steroidobacteraceae bacterium]|jgi:translocation and assembly module TamA|nr:BamA/TamA family outer membrane protein [Steroidobacteraceae bacterium]
MRSVWLPGCVLLCVLVCQRATAAVDLTVRGVNDPLRSNVLAYLSLARYKDRDLDATMVQRLRERIEREVREALRPFGYYAPIVSSDVTRKEQGKDKNNWRVEVHIDPGLPVLMTAVSIRVSGEGSTDPRFIRIIKEAALHVGDQLDHAAYDHIKSELQDTAGTYGYLDARLTHSELKVDPAKLAATADLELATGPRYRFGATTIDQSVLDVALVKRYIRYHEGDPFDLGELLHTQFALDDSQYFAAVEVKTGEPDRVKHLVPVSITAQPGKRDRYQFGAGYGTDTGPRGIFVWDRRLVNGSGHHFDTQLEASAKIQQLQSQYIVPIGDPALEHFAMGAAIQQSIPGDLNNKDFSLGPSVTLVRDRWQYVWAVTPTYSVTSDGYTVLRDRLVVPSLTIASVPRGYLGEALFERGLQVEIRGAAQPLGSSVSFLQLHVTDERVFPIASGWHLLLRGELGTTLVSRLSQLPGSFRFFAGGDESVRGFGFDDLSPIVAYRNANGAVTDVKVGGRHVISGSAEIIRDLPRNLGVSVFSDFGNAFDTFGHAPNPAYPHFMEYSVGVGLRWRLPVLTFGVDVAEPISRPGAGPRFDINFSPKL